MGRGSEWTFFSREEIQIAKRCMKRYSTWLIIRKCKSKPQWDIISHLLEWLISKRRKNNKCWWGCGEKGILMHCWWQFKLGYLLWKTVWKFLKKLKIELPYNQHSTSGYLIWRKGKLEKFYASPSSLQHYLQQPRHETILVFICGWMDTHTNTHTHT